MKLFGFKEFSASPYFVQSATSFSTPPGPTNLKVNYTKDRVRALSLLGKLILVLFFGFYEFTASYVAYVFVQIAIVAFKEGSIEALALGLVLLICAVFLTVVFCQAVPRLFFALKVLFEPRLKKRLPKRSFWGE